MADNEPAARIERWLGLNNVAEPAALPLGWLRQADNLVLDDAGWARRRRGLTELIPEGIEAVYALRNEEALLAVVDGDLCEVLEDASTQLLLAGVGAGPYRWAELANTVVLMGSERAIRLEPGAVGELGIELPARVTLAAIPGSLPAGTYQVALTLLREPSGLESGAREAATIAVNGSQAIQVSGIEQRSGDVARLYVSEPNGVVLYRNQAVFGGAATITAPGGHTPLRTMGLLPPPLGVEIAFHQARLWVAEYEPSPGVTHLWRSRPFQPHLFDRLRDWLTVPGRVEVMGSTPNGLLIGTDREVYGWVPTEDRGEVLIQQANYGAVRGSLAWLPDGAVIFWTRRGAATALPYQNLTEDRLSAPFGRSAPGAVVELDGVRQYLAAPQSEGWSHNPAPVQPSPSLATNTLVED